MVTVGIAKTCGVLLATIALAAGAAHAASFTSPPSGSALVYADFQDELRCHVGITAADISGASTGRLWAGSVAALTTDDQGTLWASTGCTAGRGIPMPACAVWRAGTSAPAVTVKTVRRRLMAKGLLALGERPYGLLCSITPMLRGGVQSIWENARIVIGPDGKVRSVGYISRSAAARQRPSAVTSSGRAVFPLGTGPNYLGTRSRVDGLGVFDGQVLDIRSDGRRLLRVPGNPVGGEGEASSDRVVLVEPDGTVTFVWQTVETMYEVGSAQFLPGGQSAIVRAGEFCAFCERNAYRVTFGQPASEGQLLIPRVGGLRVLP